MRDGGISLRRRLVLLTAGSPLFVLEGTPRATALSEEMGAAPIVLLRLVGAFSVVGSGGGAALARLSRKDMREVGREEIAGGFGSMPMIIDWRSRLALLASAFSSSGLQLSV